MTYFDGDELKSRIQAALEQLGSTHMEVSESLLKGGFSGRRAHSGSCPVANYIYAQVQDTAADLGASVYHTWGVYHDPDGYGFVCSGLTPPAVVDFIQEFDRGHYPALVRGKP